MATAEQEAAANRQEMEDLAKRVKALQKENEELLQHHAVQREVIDALNQRTERAKKVLNGNDPVSD